jgi:hypothetical protein
VVAMNTNELIKYIDDRITNLDPTPIIVNDDFPLRWESNINIEDYDFSKNYLDLDKAYESLNSTVLKSVATAIVVEKDASGIYEYWDGVFMVETHVWCSKLNDNDEFPSFSLINERFDDINDLKEFLLSTYS